MKNTLIPFGLVVSLAVAWTPGLAQDQTAARISCHNPPTLRLMQAHRFDEALALERKRLQELGPVEADVRAFTVSVCIQRLIGGMLGRLERDQEALSLLESLVQQARERIGPNHHETLQTELVLAAAYGRIGRQDRAIRLLQSLRPLYAKRYGARSYEMRNLLVALATSYHWIGNYAEALPVERESFAVAQELANTGKCQDPVDCQSMVAKTQSGLADTLRRLQLASEAMPHAEQSTATLERVVGPFHADTLNARLVIASTFSAMGQRDKAFAIEQDVYENARRHLGDEHPVTRKARGNMAASLQAKGATTEATGLERLQLAQLREKRGVHHPETLLSLSNLSQRLISAKEYDAALPLLEEALSVMLNTRAGLSFDDRLILAYQDNWRRLVDAYVGTLIRLKRSGDAFLVAEFFKARLLAERMALDAGERGLSPEQSDALRKLRRALGHIDQTIAMKRTLSRPTADEDVTRARILQRMHELQQSSAPRDAALPSQANPPDWYRSILLAERDQARISYLFLGRSALAFVESGGTLSTVAIGNRDAISESVEAYRLLVRSRALLEGAPPAVVARQLAQVWTRPGGGFVAGQKPGEDARQVTEPGEVADFLSAALLRPLAPRLAGKTRIIVSPDQVLSHVPFDALTLEGRRLGDIAEVMVLPSLALYSRLAQRKATYAGLQRMDLLAIGGAPYRRITQIAPNVLYSREKHMSLRPMDLTVIAQQIRKDPSRLPMAFAAQIVGSSDLPATLTEVNALRALVGPANSVALAGEQATEENFNRLAAEGRLAQFRAVHLTAHGYLSDDEPALSAIVLSQVNRAPGTDGYLTMAELSSVELKSDLVVLSSCDSGVGKVRRGEAMLGLSYALFQAGTVASIVTLWPIPDKESALLMVRFYEEWKNGVTAARALSNAKRWALNSGIAPYAVDAFVLFGL